jgi:putative ABC transport system ATP-binding protein
VNDKKQNHQQNPGQISDEPPIIEVKDLSYSVEGQQILADIRLKIYPGDRMAVFGPSGAGKSTLIRLLNRLDEPTSGTILVEGRDYREIPPQDLRRRLGMVMQRPHLFPGTVAENLRFGPEANGQSLSKDEIADLLAGVDLEGFADRSISRLSGGEAQRVNLARTLANKPQVLLLDEPTSSLDSAAKKDVEETILSVIQNQHVTCLLVTHDRAQARRLAERVAVLEKGKLVRVGPVEEVLDAESMD